MFKFSIEKPGVELIENLALYHKVQDYIGNIYDKAGDENIVINTDRDELQDKCIAALTAIYDVCSDVQVP